jgi:hypothetical protein
MIELRGLFTVIELCKAHEGSFGVEAYPLHSQLERREFNRRPITGVSADEELCARL